MATLTMTQTRERASSHKEYLDSLHRPTLEEWRRISDIQRRQEAEIDSKYHTTEALSAAKTIQKAYRGHRARRELQGLTLDPSSRWVELIRELRFHAATMPHHGPASPFLDQEKRQRAPSDVAKKNWQRIAYIAEHAGGAEVRPSSRQPEDYFGDFAESVPEPREVPESMLMDSRYFLELVDSKHRYGSNLKVYHEEWLRTNVQENFFYWLDHGAGRHLDLPGCSRAKLDREHIRYLSREERLAYLVDIDDEGRLRWNKDGSLITTSAEHYKDSMVGIVRKDSDEPSFNDEEVARQRSHDRRAFSNLLRARSPDARSISDGSSDSSSEDSSLRPISSHERTVPTEKKQRRKHLVSPATILNHLLRASVRADTWIYVRDTVGRLYVGIKSSGAFQHASFLSGARISSAGSIGIEDGRLTYLSPLSGHYRPTTRSFQSFLKSLKDQGADLSHVRVSHAYEVLEGLEVYSQSKKGVKKVLKVRKDEQDSGPRSPELDQKFHVKMDGVSATSFIERNWDREHRKGIHKLMDELRISRRKNEAGLGKSDER